MMLKLILLALVATALAAPKSNVFQAKSCDKEQCQLPDCKCTSTDPPQNLEIASVPQFVFLTFDDAVTAANYETYKDVFYGKTNPDGCPIGATYFMAHEYTDYSKVHDLYLNGHGIALHSITHNASTDYWRTISKDLLTQEFGDEKTLAAHWANIPEEAVHGMRLPFLQQSGDSSYQVAKEIGLKYDCSWPTQTFIDPPLWPYTLDYLSNQDCPIGPCPKESIPGLWVIPMVDWKDNNGIVCSMVDACVNIPTDEDGVLEWYKTNFNRHYQGNKAPFGFYVHAAWFSVDASHLPAYKKFIDYLQTLPDVFIVPIGRGLEWIQNPVAIGSENWPACPDTPDLGCTPTSCQLQKGEEIRYMTVCTNSCPDVFPWLGNPLGQV